MKNIYTIRIIRIYRKARKLTRYLWHPTRPILAEELPLWRQDLWIIQRSNHQVAEFILHGVLQTVLLTQISPYINSNEPSKNTLEGAAARTENGSGCPEEVDIPHTRK
jgi:hypothetical protein